MKRIFLGLITFMFLGSSAGYAGTYLNSAHGTQNDAITGVERLSGYIDGNCAHCHEQHASIGGTEPAPVGDTPDKYLLFSTNHTSQTVNFCFDCHVDASSQQTGGFIKNYSYTYRAGNYDDGINDIKQAFDTANTSSHDLDDIVTFITDKWGFTANSNPCCGCHNPHAAQGDPAGSTSAKSSSTRGYPVSRPSLHSTLTSWGLWGDADGEKMDDYTGYYQAPYRDSATPTYEPDGSTTTDGSNLTDYVTFCQDCHTTDMNLSPYVFGLTNTSIDWDTDGDKHGEVIATATSGANINLREPYLTAWTTFGLVVACTDCHEPHGAPNVMLIREKVNGSAVASIDTIVSPDTNGTAPGVASPNTEFIYICNRCHTAGTKDELCIIHHSGTDAPYSFSSCKDCHYDKGSGNDCNAIVTQISCTNCHFHGSDDSWAGGSQRTF